MTSEFPDSTAQTKKTLELIIPALERASGCNADELRATVMGVLTPDEWAALWMSYTIMESPNTAGKPQPDCDSQKLVRLRGKALIKYRHQRLETMREEKGEMEHAAMRLGWGKEWHREAKADLLRAGRRYGQALQEHWVTINAKSITVPNVDRSPSPTSRSVYFPLFKHMTDNHGLALLDSEMAEICEVALGMMCFVCARRIRRGGQRAGNALCNQCYNQSGKSKTL
jgi:hypothetical protein